MKRQASSFDRGLRVLLVVASLGLVAGATVLVAPLEANGQSRERERGDRGGADIDRLAEQLGLSEEQKTLVEPVFAAHHERMKELRQDESLERDARRELAEQYDSELEEKLASILTDEQLATFKELHQQRRPPRRGMRRSR